MNGQWIGDYTGTKSGRIIVNIDERPSNFEGVAYLFGEGQAVAETAAFFRTVNKDTNFEIRTGLILPIDRRTFIPAQWSMERAKNLKDAILKAKSGDSFVGENLEPQFPS